MVPANKHTTPFTFFPLASLLLCISSFQSLILLSRWFVYFKIRPSYLFILHFISNSYNCVSCDLNMNNRRKKKEEEHYGNRQKERQTGAKVTNHFKLKKISWSSQELLWQQSKQGKNDKVIARHKQENRIWLGEHMVTSCSSSPSKRGGFKLFHALE